MDPYLMPYYLGYYLALQVKLSFYPALLSMWITAMPLVRSSCATQGSNKTILGSLILQIFIFTHWSSHTPLLLWGLQWSWSLLAEPDWRGSISYCLGMRGLNRRFPPIISLFLPHATLRTSPDSIFLSRRCLQKEKSIMLILAQRMRPSSLWHASPTHPPSSKSLL